MTSCPHCGGAVRYQGATTIECATVGCVNGKAARDVYLPGAFVDVWEGSGWVAAAGIVINAHDDGLTTVAIGDRTWLCRPEHIRPASNKP